MLGYHRAHGGESPEGWMLCFAAFPKAACVYG
jgi:hypothetical protein